VLGRLGGPEGGGVSTVLDWRGSAHWSRRRLPCDCGRLTNLRDGAGRPAHKTCAEAALSLHTDTQVRRSAHAQMHTTDTRKGVA